MEIKGQVPNCQWVPSVKSRSWFGNQDSPFAVPLVFGGRGIREGCHELRMGDVPETFQIIRVFVLSMFGLTLRLPRSTIVDISNLSVMPPPA